MTAFAITAGRSLWANVLAFLESWSSHRQAERRIRAERERIYRELDSCTDRELAELNVSRADIPAIANGTYPH